MIVDWIKFTNALGTTESSKEFHELKLAIGEQAEISKTPLEYNDPIGQTTYYSFAHSGIEIGFRQGLLNHIHFYFDNSEGYANFKGNLLLNIRDGWNEENVIQILGEPLMRGGGKIDMLLGYINSWIKYEYQKYVLHLQFNQDGLLYGASLML
ncbi:hypothetical protein [Photorhabdus heterorhabditis]|uniref:Uncharacterized protein n=1 Tax=Photorhabdus heterorhabditis TaxID=880156 RepID=A0A5B0WLC6_9GAMM|nr:hypothetical protein [Photorhabdus heterorhabditis]KAA1187636.1 hypothetical protein F0L16_12650 [Photorhabdus heterorhabditis]MBS9442702.1 hypothetical protein [Photorhabdus heterorhabditis]